MILKTFVLILLEKFLLRKREVINMHPYSDKLIELNQEPLNKWIKTYKTLNSYEHKNKTYLMNFVFNKLAIAFGGFEYFWENEEEAKFVMESWINMCGDLTCPQVISGLYEILKARTEFIGRPPNTPMQFYHVCKNSCHQIPTEYVESIEKKNSSSENIVQENLLKIRNMINNSLCLLPRGK